MVLNRNNFFYLSKYFFKLCLGEMRTSNFKLSDLALFSDLDKLCAFSSDLTTCVPVESGNENCPTLHSIDALKLSSK